jgi:hypothetical protein
MPHQVIWMFGAQRQPQEVPCAWFELDPNNGSIHWLSVHTYHPEWFLRVRSAHPTVEQRMLGFRERLGVTAQDTLYILCQYYVGQS